LTIFNPPSFFSLSFFFFIVIRFFTFILTNLIALYFRGVYSATTHSLSQASFFLFAIGEEYTALLYFSENLLNTVRGLIIRHQAWKNFVHRYFQHQVLGFHYYGVIPSESHEPCSLQIKKANPTLHFNAEIHVLLRATCLFSFKSMLFCMASKLHC